MDKYECKIVLVCPVASWFRGNDLEFVFEKLSEYKENGIGDAWLKIKSDDDLTFCFSLQQAMANLTCNYITRVEHPLISIYTNDKKCVETLTNLDSSRVKYITIPSKAGITSNTVVVKTLDYDYKIHMGRTRKSYSDFLVWSENNKKIRLPRRMKTDLGKISSWGGGHFYVKGENTLTMVKLFLGSDIHKIEHVIKA
jgi:hypothetical protein